MFIAFLDYIFSYMLILPTSVSWWFFTWVRMTANLLDISHYSVRYYPCYDWYLYWFFVWFSVPAVFVQAIRNRSMCTAFDWWHRHPYNSNILVSIKNQGFIHISVFYDFHNLVLVNGKIDRFTISFNFLIDTRLGCLTEQRLSVCISKSQRILRVILLFLHKILVRIAILNCL